MIEWWDGLLKTWLQHPLDGNTLQDWAEFLQKAVNALNQCPTYVAMSPKAKIHESRGFPGGAVVESPPANAGNRGSGPRPGGSHMPRSNWARAPRLLSLRSRAREPQLLSPRATTTEACAPGARAL